MNYFNYFTEIEDEFVRRRGSHLLVSPLDWSLMEMWKQRGVPLHIVLRGINSSFDSYESRPFRGRKVNSLFYCQQEVETMFREYCESRVGGNGNGQTQETGSGSSFDAGTIADYLTEQSQSLNRLGQRYSTDAALNQTLERVEMRLSQIIEDLRAAINISPEALETDLTMIEEVILDGLKESAGEGKLAEIRKEGKQQLRAYRESMNAEVYRQTLDNFVARRLRENYQVPRLSLFYL